MPRLCGTAGVRAVYGQTGSGSRRSPSGLSAAYYLQLMGHQVTVYEMLPELGGMLRYGIPNYRLPKERLDQDIQAILDTGVKVEFGKDIGKDISLAELKEQYDAVLISIGASTDKKMGLEGEDADGVISAVQVLRNVALGQEERLDGQEVAVIGGGNVSMDAVRTAVRLGAKKVSILYRRRVADMTALPDEIQGAEAEGVEIRTLMAPSRVEKNEGRKSRRNLGYTSDDQRHSKWPAECKTVRRRGRFDSMSDSDRGHRSGHRIPAF